MIKIDLPSIIESTNSLPIVEITEDLPPTKSKKKPKKKKGTVDLRTHLNPVQNYFFKRPKKEDERICYNQSVFEIPIYEGDNIITYSDIDCEYQSTESLFNSFCNLTQENYKKIGDYPTFFNKLKADIKKKHNFELEEIVQNPSRFKKLLDVSCGGKSEWRELEKIFTTDHKLSSPVLLSSQIKNSLSEERGQIFISRAIGRKRESLFKHYKENNISFPKPREYQNINKGFVLLEDLATKGVESSIERFDSQDDFEREAEGLATHEIVFTTFFGVVDVVKVFTDPDYIKDVRQLVLDEQIIHDKRLKEVKFVEKKGKHYTSEEKIYKTGARLNWIITHNGLKYRVKLGFVDVTASQGLTSLNEWYINNGIDNEVKKSLDEYKPCMLEALINEPETYNHYGLGDIRLTEGLRGFNDNLRDIYKNLGIKDYFKEARMTIGNGVSDIIQALIFKKLGITPEAKAAMSNTDINQFFAAHTMLASPQYLQEYSPHETVNKHLFDGNTLSYNRYPLAKVDGGRAHPYIPSLPLNSKHCTLFDIDITGAYTSKMSNQSFYLGSPVIDIRPLQDRISLRKHIVKFKKELGKDNYFMRVSGLLENEQDLIVSFLDAEKGLKYHKRVGINDDGEAELLKNIRHSLESTNNKILTMEIEKGIIAPDILDLILNEYSPKQRDDFLDNLYVTAFIYYPPSMELATTKEYKDKQALHEWGKYNGSFEKHRKYQDREILKPFNHYIKIDYGKFVVDVGRTYRAKYKKAKNKPLDQMFKLIGNTIYGINVSKYFPTSNVVFGNNITAGVRCCIWYAEKALNFRQTITDGGIGDANAVPYPVYSQFDTLSFVRGYQKTDRELARNDKCELKPLTRTLEPITFNPIKQLWLVDGEYYNEDDYKKIIAELALEHIQRCFSKNRLMNELHRHLTFKNLNVDDEEITPEYIYQKGGFTLEIKDILRKVAFTGMTNYSYTNWKGEVKTKNRSFETKKNDKGEVIKPHIAFFLDVKGKLYLDEDFYKYTSPSEMVFKALENDPERVPLIPPFALNTLIKTKDWVMSYDKTYKWSSLNFGDSSYKIAMKSLFELSAFKFKNKEQAQSWLKAHGKLKKKYHVTFERYFMNEDGTCNVKLMNDVIDKMISQGVVNPIKGLPSKNIKGLDSHYNFSKKNINRLKLYIGTIEQAKRFHRLSIIGLHKFLHESTRPKKDYGERVIYDEDIDYYDVDKYSTSEEHLHHDLPQI